ncbi:MAG: metallophosphoesterase [Polyangiaceae bacterium]
MSRKSHLFACLIAGAALAAFSAGCGDDSEVGGGGSGGGAGGAAPPEPLPALSKAPLTTEERLSVATTPVTGDPAHDPRLPENVASMLADGFADYSTSEGEAVESRLLDGTAAPPPGANAKVLARFVHLADLQLADDESPSRVCNTDVPLTPTNGAFRPQEGHECRILNAAVRTINRLNQDSPLDLVILGGDNIDNAQSNEADWVLGLLGGASVIECDSGVDDDPVPGPNNDPKDPFVAEGLAVPYVWVTGNHDVLTQGNFPPANFTDEYLSDYAATGTRDWSQPGAPVKLGDVPADEARMPLTGSELLTLVQADGDGHGVTSAAATSGRAFYTYDVPNTPLRFIVIDTSAPTGSAEGLLHQSEIDDFLVPALDTALADDKLVIVASHHASGSLTDGGNFGGVAQPDAVLTDPFRDILAGYPNVLMHLAGHSHVHKVNVIQPTVGAPYWEVLTSALADFPSQMRLVEIRDLDNGYYGIRLTALDYQTENDPIAEDGRKLAIIDVTSGWEKADHAGVASDRNVELYVPKP